MRFLAFTLLIVNLFIISCKTPSGGTAHLLDEGVSADKRFFVDCENGPSEGVRFLFKDGERADTYVYIKDVVNNTDKFEVAKSGRSYRHRNRVNFSANVGDYLIDFAFPESVSYGDEKRFKVKVEALEADLGRETRLDFDCTSKNIDDFEIAAHFFPFPSDAPPAVEIVCNRRRIDRILAEGDYSDARCKMETQPICYRGNVRDATNWFRDNDRIGINQSLYNDIRVERVSADTIYLIVVPRDYEDHNDNGAFSLDVKACP